MNFVFHLQSTHKHMCRAHISYFYGAYIIYFVAGIHGFFASCLAFKNPAQVSAAVQCIMTVPQCSHITISSFHIFLGIFILWFRLEIWKLPYTPSRQRKQAIQCMCPLHACVVYCRASACAMLPLSHRSAHTLTRFFVCTLNSIDAVTHWQIIMWYIAFT